MRIMLNEEVFFSPNYLTECLEKSLSKALQSMATVSSMLATSVEFIISMLSFVCHCINKIAFSENEKTTNNFLRSGETAILFLFIQTFTTSINLHCEHWHTLSGSASTNIMRKYNLGFFLGLLKDLSLSLFMTSPQRTSVLIATKLVTILKFMTLYDK